jgi:uncharacterized protein
MRVYLDTSGLIALINEDDRHHTKAVDVWNTLLQQKTQSLTSSLILIELADGLAKLKYRQLTFQLTNGLAELPTHETVFVDEDIERLGWELYEARDDKEWGMTDCISFELMRIRGVQSVFGLDHHFDQAGFKLMLK